MRGLRVLRSAVMASRRGTAVVMSDGRILPDSEIERAKIRGPFAGIDHASARNWSKALTNSFPEREKSRARR